MRRIYALVAFVQLTLCAGLAQDAAANTGANRSPTDSMTPSEFEAEFVSSDVFRSASYVQPVWRGIAFDGHYFGSESTDVGFTGGSYTFTLAGIHLSPGAGVLFGSNGFTTMPTLSFRWDYERLWFVTQGMVLQGLGQAPVFEEGQGAPSEGSAKPVSGVRPTISDGSHLSVRWTRFTIGGTWEHVHFREGNEWTGGGRLAFRILPRLSAILYVLAPGTVEWRGGILVHPRQRD